MDEKLTKTSLKQRLFIGFIAFLMLGSFAAVYIGIAVGGSESSEQQNANVDQTKLNELLKDFTDKKAAADEAAKPFSDKYFSELSKYRSEVKAYNANSINEGGLTTNDLKQGTGSSIGDDTQYLAYYIGWCADESILDSSFDDYESPAALKTPLNPSIVPLIEGWTSGVKGMKIGGVRELSIPGSLAYGDTREICGGKNSPLKFVIMTIYDENLAKLTYDAEYANYRYMYYANYGIDINDMSQSESGDDTSSSDTTEGTTSNDNSSDNSSDTTSSDNSSSTDESTTTRKRKTSDVLMGL